MNSPENSFTLAIDCLSEFLDHTLRFYKRERRTPSRCHLQVTEDYQTALCGQLDGWKTGPARTFYSFDTSAVTCKKCKKMKFFKSQDALAQLAARLPS